MTTLFSGKTKDAVLGTIYVEAIRVQDKVTTCSHCQHRGVEILAMIRCTNTAATYTTTVCLECRPTFSRSLFDWYLSGTTVLKTAVQEARNADRD